MKAKQGIVVGGYIFRQRGLGDRVVEHPTQVDTVWISAHDTETD